MTNAEKKYKIENIKKRTKKMFIDTHAHLNYEDRYGDAREALAEAAQAGVKKVICVGWDLPSSALAAHIA